MGSMSKAAEEMYITRSALSRCIKKVEEELDTPLFKRVPSGIVPTQAGEIYIRYAEKFLTEIRKMKSEIYEISKEYSGTVCVGATYSIVASVLSHALCAFWKNTCSAARLIFFSAIIRSSRVLV